MDQKISTPVDGQKPERDDTVSSKESTDTWYRLNSFMSKVQNGIAKVEKAFGIFAMGFIIVINIYGISSRYLFNKPVLYIQELTILGAVWLFFIGMGLVFKVHSDITVEFIVKYLSRRLRLLNNLIVDVLILIFVVILAVQTVKFVIFLGGQGESHALSFALELPDQIYFCPIGVGAFSIFLTIFHRFVQRLASFPSDWRSPQKPGEVDPL
jgi:TRAP-type C4-dicarboxylate transport system permease small subunit